MNTNAYAAPRTTTLLPSQKACQECHAAINRKAEICPKCGVRQKNAVSKIALLLITFFMGGMGLHKFYFRKPIQGILYILFAITGIPSLIALVEFIVYACTSEERLNEKYEATGSIVLVIVAIFVMIAIIGILAAIALPAYQDYTLRAKIVQSLDETRPLQKRLEQFITNPDTTRDEVAAFIASTPVQVSHSGVVTVDDQGKLVLRFESQQNSALFGKTIEIVPAVSNGQVTLN